MPCFISVTWDIHAVLGNCQAVCESLAHVPARIGASLLKVYVCAALFPLFSTWCRHAVPLTIDQCKLRSSQGVEILPTPGRQPEDDYDAISSGLYVEKGKGASRAWTFKMVKNQSPTVEVLLEIPLEVYKDARRRADGDDDDVSLSADRNLEVLLSLSDFLYA